MYFIYNLLKWDRKWQFVNESIRSRWGLVIDGPSLNFVLDKKNSNLFIELTQYCSSVLCCRVTPIQKAVVVKCVKHKLKALTMAVGDGANDVVMIKTANVGVGISGLEGTQAVMASDFSVPKFHHLERLILVHGNLCYNRLAMTILYFFYKNTIFILVIMFFQFYCGFSGQTPLDDVYLMLVNVCFTTFPPILRGIVDKDCPEEMLLRHPKLYERGRYSRVYTNYSFWVNTTDSIYQSCVIFYVSYLFYYNTSVGVYDFGRCYAIIIFVFFHLLFVYFLFLSTGLNLFTMIIITNLLQIALETKYWPWFYIWSLVLSFVSYFAIVFLLDLIYTRSIIDTIGGHNYKVLYVRFFIFTFHSKFILILFYSDYYLKCKICIQNLVRFPQFWLSFFIIPIICMIPRCTFRTLQQIFKPQFEVKESF